MGLNIIQAPLVDMEIRGVPALKFLGDIVWKQLQQGKYGHSECANQLNFPVCLLRAAASRAALQKIGLWTPEQAWAVRQSQDAGSICPYLKSEQMDTNLRGFMWLAYGDMLNLAVTQDWINFHTMSTQPIYKQRCWFFIPQTVIHMAFWLHGFVKALFLWPCLDGENFTKACLIRGHASPCKNFSVNFTI